MANRIKYKQKHRISAEKYKVKLIFLNLYGVIVLRRDFLWKERL